MSWVFVAFHVQITNLRKMWCFELNLLLNAEMDDKFCCTGNQYAIIMVNILEHDYGLDQIHHDCIKIAPHCVSTRKAKCYQICCPLQVDVVQLYHRKQQSIKFYSM